MTSTDASARLMPSPRPARRAPWRGVAKQRGLIAICVVFLLLLGLVNLLSPARFSFFDVNSLSSGSAALALSAMGQTLIILVGGFDLSAGAVVSLVNAVVATTPQASAAGMIGVCLLGVAVGAAVGAVNGLFVAFMRLQSIVVTLATMFLIHGVTLLVLPEPGGAVAPAITSFFIDPAIPGLLPRPIVLLVLAALLWLAIKRTRFGTALYAVGSDEDAAYAAGIAARWVKFIAFVLGGAFFGAAGVFISAQTGSGDPLVGDPLLLQIFTAVVLGGTLLGGGRGGAVGSIVGAFTLMLMINLLLVMDVSAYYSTILEGCVLLVAVLFSALGSRSPLQTYVLQARQRWRGWRGGTLARQVRDTGAPAQAPAPARALGAKPSWVSRHAELLRTTLPAYVCFLGVMVATGFVYGPQGVGTWGFYNSLLVLSCFLAILALGQGMVILTGGLDLSVPWIIGFSGILAAGLISGSNAASVWVIPLTLALGGAIGAANGLGIVLLGLPPIVMTLAMNGILQGLALIYSQGTPSGFSSPGLRWFMTGSLGGATPVVYLIIAFVIGAVVLLGRTSFGRRVYAVGNSPRVAFLSGVGVGRTTLMVYVISGLCAALVGILLTGFSGQASLGMGDEYLLPSIAVVVVGGSLITGGRGHYLGMIGGVLLLTGLQTLLAGTTLPHAVRDIIFGLVVLGAVVALREKA